MSEEVSEVPKELLDDGLWKPVGEEASTDAHTQNPSQAQTHVHRLNQPLCESVRDAVGRKVKLSLRRRVKLEIKGDKTENRVLLWSDESGQSDVFRKYHCQPPLFPAMLISSAVKHKMMSRAVIKEN
ncbi:hypothetical protein NQZ68_018709 [Dissostichus eleginoides]|nr:hypothetical protein NQZ68_018709 [Dissostichus eleginoides]